MTIYENRYSCRAYDSSRKISDDDLHYILEAARMAPSACNRQPWTFVVVVNEDARKAIFQSYEREWLLTAPILVVAFGHHDTAWHRPHDNKDHTDVDLAIAVEHICLAAAEKGIGSCWICNFDKEKINSYFKPEPGVEPIAIIPLGYAQGDAPIPNKVRKGFDEIIKWNSL